VSFHQQEFLEHILETEKDKMESSSKLKYVKQSPYKVRFIADLIRGKNVEDAINILSSTNKKASKFLIKLLNSAVANINYIDNDLNIDQSDLYIKTIFVDGGPMLKRFRPAAMGRAAPIRKRMSHITVIIENK
jgi:large subunit ribosomal protein L22